MKSTMRTPKRSFYCFLACFYFFISFFAAYAEYEAERERMVREAIIAEGIEDEAVIRSMRAVPREEFVPARLEKQAYLNRPLPIGYGQTISQPYIVALMTQLLEVDEDDTVLEIGTGSGYQAAVLAEIVKTVHTVEIIQPLAESAAKRLQRLGYSNVKTYTGDGYFGLEEQSPFDAIIVTAASDHVPPPLIRQLKKGGRMCIPVGQPYYPQVLKLIVKDNKGGVTIRDILPVVFVPLTRANDHRKE
jgi:protein-L-isoaspartate(D-aspartate) O-methyltransferase